MKKENVGEGWRKVNKRRGGMRGEQREVLREVNREEGEAEWTGLLR